ncbi:MAG: sigma 54-interacting transcriptional regulator, partial [Deltaproteobacteria bacterium]
ALRAVMVGRSPIADFRLTDPTVSSFHVEVSAVAGGIQVREANSRNGVIFGGARLRDAIVPSGATLEIGSTLLRVQTDVAFHPEAAESASFGALRGRSTVMRELFSMLGRLSRSDLSLVIEGPTGTGKELAARAVHDASRNARGPFMVLDCTAIPATLAESMLFGHERGAFTGATERRAGIFEACEGGTVFLDEVGELPTELQPKLLRVLERREVVRVGSQKPVPVRVRVVCATWRDLRAMVNEGKFREDLYYRLAQARVTLPALVDRRDDIGMLVYHFLQAIPEGVPVAREISPEALEELVRREYPGNVRELKSVVERASVMAEANVITPSDLAFERILTGHGHAAAIAPAIAEGVSDSGAVTPFKDAKRSVVDEFEKAYIQRLLARTQGNLTRAASLAGVERHHLRELVRKHGIRGDEA